MCIRDSGGLRELGVELHLSLIHISEPTRPLYISYAVFCLKKCRLLLAQLVVTQSEEHTKRQSLIFFKQKTAYEM